MGREERKVVTILFTDLVGSTAMAEELDDDELRADALNTRGLALRNEAGVADLRRSVELADASMSPLARAVSRNNLASTLSTLGLVREALPLWAEAVEIGLRAGSAAIANFPASRASSSSAALSARSRSPRR